MPLTLRLRHNGTNATLADVPDAATVAELRELISAKLSVAVRRLVLKVGYPPAPLSEDSATKPVAEVGIRNRDTIVVEEREPPPEPLPAAGSAEALAAAAEAARKLGLPAPPASAEVGGIERHVIAADNSCLFNSVAYCLAAGSSGSQKPPAELRALVAERIAADPERWDPVTLAESEKTSLEYADWIKRSESWGGSIELMVLSESLGVQFSAVCIRSMRVDHYPHEGPYKHRVFVLYDGIHYDAVVGRSAQSAGSELRVFDPADDLSLNKVIALAVTLQEQKQFTDTSNFTLQCQHCWAKFKGETDAQKHGKETGHFNFQEVH
eukprot:gnl/TRDRNA2_/TRDRNA2_85711_c0_seq1.p1 gnl/TRDRNA2_/TRDRNA2_85711_c0~~gnl/TRDRNA2_/TRDRNA2_85711_c0_seq1.p1  ORF type:complete len:324 (+),score=81.49 gnl/TRDRNA2_/TRDRNA2_85711_c0_seq1:67-1038(+)